MISAGWQKALQAEVNPHIQVENNSSLCVGGAYERHRYGLGTVAGQCLMRSPYLQFGPRPGQVEVFGVLQNAG